MIEELIAEPRDSDDRSLVIETIDGAPVGLLIIFSCDPHCGTFWHAAVISHEYRRKGFATRALRMAMAYYFNERRFQKACGRVWSFNEAALRLHAKLGYTVEARVRRMLYHLGCYHDEIIVGMTCEEFRDKWDLVAAGLDAREVADRG